MTGWKCFTNLQKKFQMFLFKAVINDILGGLVLIDALDGLALDIAVRPV